MKNFSFQAGTVCLWGNALAAASVLSLSLISAHAQSIDLPGPEGGDGFFGIRVVRDNGVLSEIFDAEISLASGLGSVTDAVTPWVNHSDPGAPGHGGIFGADDPFPGDRPGDENHFAWLAKGNILVPEPGFYTFGFDGDDGQALWLEGANFAINGGTGSVPAGVPNMFWVPDPTSRAFTTASTFLAPGVHKLRYLGWDSGGGAFGEVFSAKGDVNIAQWLLVGDTSVLPETSPPLMLNGSAEVVNAPSLMNNTVDGARHLIDEALSSGQALSSKTDILVLTDGNGICCGRPGVIMEEAAVPFPIDDTGQEDHFATGIFGTLIVDDGDEIPDETHLLTVLLSSDDGSQFHILGEKFIGKGSNGSLESVNEDVALTADFPSGNTDTYGIINLTEGIVYEFEGWHFEINGDAGWEIWAALGDFRDDFASGSFAPVSSVAAPLILPGNQGLALVDQTIAVEIDVAPENNENAVEPYNINSSKHLEVAVLSTPDFDATTFSEGLFSLCDADSPNLGLVQTSSTSMRDTNSDGLTDLVVDFGPARDIAADGTINLDTVTIKIIGTVGSDSFAGSGASFEGRGASFEGHDTVKVLGK